MSVLRISGPALLTRAGPLIFWHHDLHLIFLGNSSQKIHESITRETQAIPFNLNPEERTLAGDTRPTTDHHSDRGECGGFRLCTLPHHRTSRFRYPAVEVMRFPSQDPMESFHQIVVHGFLSGSRTDVHSRTPCPACRAAHLGLPCRTEVVNRYCRASSFPRMPFNTLMISRWLSWKNNQARTRNGR